MIKLTFCLRRLPNLSYEEFHDYWLNNHGPLVRSVQDKLKIKHYVQVHARKESPMSDALRASRNAPEPYDGVAELWFESEDAILQNQSDPEAQAAGKMLLEDEKKFIDLENSPLWFNEEHEIIPLETT